MHLTELVTHPLGLAAFALALVFGVAGVKLAARKRPWFLPTAIALAAFVIVGGLFLAYKDIHAKEKNTATTPPEAKPQEVRQETHGDIAPVFKDVEGPVTIIVNQGGKEK